MLKRPLALLVLTFLLMFQSSCGQTRAPAEHAPGLGQPGKPRYTNALIHESSPYLLQHAHNPVHWYPWGEAALKKARDEHKMLLISIGYAACHWCHVMERESYEDTAVARLMNEHFVSIKVDREERPDVDQVYLTAAQLITGSGGWPLNALATPDGKPFYAGTYFPRDEWMKMLRFYIDLNQKNPAALREQAAQVTQGIHSAEPVPFRKAAAPVTPAMLDAAFGAMQPRLDYANGGEAGTPKFPMPAVWEYLLYYHYLSKNPSALTAVTTTLERLAMGGIYDQVGGGFARYSTDARWHVPHFEKMLYDNAQLVSLYAHAYQATKNPLYKQVVYETLGFIEREMTSPEGGFYASLNADSEGEEGKFYAWSKPEIDQVLGRDAALFDDYFHVTASGNWEQGKNILFRRPDERALAAKYRRTEAQVTTTIEADKALLLRARNQRVRPTRDDKILTAWNALMLKGYVQAYRAFGDERFLQAALKNADFLGRRATTNAKGLTRNYQNGRSSIAGFLDDYAFTIAAYIELYQATFDEKWLRKAKDLAAYAQAHFADPASKMFFYTDDTHSGLIAREMELTDNVIPASNSEMAQNLYYLGHYFADDGQLNTARQMLANVQHDAQQNPYYYANWGQLEAAMASGVYEVAIVGKECQRHRRALDQYYLPNTVLLGSSGKTSLELLADKEVEGQTTIYVCQDKVCRRPVTEVREAVQQIQAR